MIWPPPPTALEGDVVRLEPLGAEHRDGLREAGDDPRIWTWMDRRIAVELDAFDRWFDARLAASAQGGEHGFATIAVADDRPIGSSSYLTVRPEHAGLEIGWTWLHPSAWGSGANLEAKLLMMKRAFDDLGCIRVEFKTDARNERSRAALERIGARFEGIFRKHMLTHVEGTRDSAYYSITDDDWPAVKAALARRIRAGDGRRATRAA
jgi:N-acetyltransferase